MATYDLDTLASLFPHMGLLENILDGLPLGVAVLDTKGRILLVNQPYCDITGASASRLMGLKCLHALRCNYCFKGCPVLTGWEKRKNRNVEADIINRSREKILIQLTLTPLLSMEGTILGTVETIAPRVTKPFAETAGSAYGLGELVGKSAQIKKIFSMAPSIAQTESPVLITGETGTGKDMLAEEIHAESNRNDGPFIKVNCSALPETLLESELFGHVKNAFPGAGPAKVGRLSTAHNGSLLLTEIGDLTPALQSKLLSYLDDHTVYPMGSGRPVRTDVRIIAASSRDLDMLARKKLFRRDLHYRLNVIQLHLPPLRERGDDIALLQDHFLRMFQGRFGKNIDGFSANADKLLRSYSYPGNIREMRNIIEYAVNFCDGKLIRLRHLPGYMLHEPDQQPATNGVEETPPPPHTPEPLAVQEPKRWEDVQRSLIMDALVKTGGKKQDAAKLLGWGRSTLWRKMKQFGMD